MPPHLCPECREPTTYRAFSGGREFWCQHCDNEGYYPEGSVWVRAGLLTTPEGRVALREQMDRELASRRRAVMLTARHGFTVTWSPDDDEYVATTPRYPSLSWMAPSRDKAVRGLVDLLVDVLEDAWVELSELRDKDLPIPHLSGAPGCCSLPEFRMCAAAFTDSGRDTGHSLCGSSWNYPVTLHSEDVTCLHCVSMLENGWAEEGGD